MLTEYQVRTIFAKYFTNDKSPLQSEPLANSCIWLYHTQEEIEAQLKLLTLPPSLKNAEEYSLRHSAVLERAIANDNYQQSYATIPYETSLEYRLEQLKK